MKLSDLATRLTCSKSGAVPVLAAATLAGAVLTAAPAAKAQHVTFGVQYGAPVYATSVPQYYGDGQDYYQRRRWAEERREAYIRQQEFARREQWERARRYNEYREHEAREHGYGGDRDDHGRNYGYGYGR